MYSCLKQSFRLPKKLFISNKNSPSKLFSSLSLYHDKHSIHYVSNNFLFKKAIKPKQIQYRFFSLDYANSFYESIRSSEATKLVTNILIGTHDFSGLPWFVTIIAAGVVVKSLVSLPCGIYQQYLVSKLELTKIELDGLIKKLQDSTAKKAISGKWTPEKLHTQFRKEVKGTWKTLIVKNNCHPFKITILFFIQLPFWLILTVSIRSFALDCYSGNVSKMENPTAALQFLVGGPFWSQNLSQPDPTLILPTINVLSMLTLTELSLSSKVNKQIAQNVQAFFAHKVLPTFFRLFAVAFFFISASSPSAVSLFWTTSSLFGLGQNLLLMSPRTRRLLRIPKTPLDVDKPYNHAYNNFVQRCQKIFTRKK